MQRSVPREVMILAGLVAVLGLWFGLMASPTLVEYDNCLSAHGYGADAWRACDLAVR